MQLLPCPDCQQLLSIPDRLAGETVLKCPKCERTDRLSDLRDASLTAWEIVGEAVWEQPQAQSTPFDDGVELDPTDENTSEEYSEEYSLVPDEPKRLPPEPRISASEARRRKKPNRKADWSSFKPITHEEFERRKKAAKSPLWSAVQIGLGGVAAIPIALLIIWHVLNKDIGGAGPIVGKYVPWIVPAQFRPTIYDASSASSSNSRSERPAPSRTNKFRQFDDIMPAPTDSNSPPGEALVLVPEESFNEADAASLPIREVKSELAEVTADIQSIDQPNTPEPDSIKPKSNATSAEPDRSGSASPAMANIDPNSFGGAIVATRTAVAQWNAYQGEDFNERKRLATEYYDRLCELPAWLANDSLDLQAPLQRPWKKQFEEVIQAIATDVNLRTLAGHGCRAKLATGNIPAETGIATFGTITALTSDGELIEFKLDENSGAQAWDFVALADLGEQLQLAVGTKILVLGLTGESQTIRSVYIQPVD